MRCFVKWSLDLIDRSSLQCKYGHIIHIIIVYTVCMLARYVYLWILDEHKLSRILRRDNQRWNNWILYVYMWERRLCSYKAAVCALWPSSSVYLLDVCAMCARKWINWSLPQQRNRIVSKIGMLRTFQLIVLKKWANGEKLLSFWMLRPQLTD